MKKTLTRSEMFSVGSWLHTNWERIERLKPTQKTVAIECGKDLNLNISPSSIASISKAIGKQWPSNRGGFGAHSRTRTGRYLATVLVYVVEALGDEDLKSKIDMARLRKLASSGEPGED